MISKETFNFSHAYKNHVNAKECINRKQMRTKKQLTDHQKNFIRNNYLKLTEPEMANILGTTRFFIQKFKRDECLAKYPYNRKKKEGFTDMEEVIAEAYFDIDEYLK